MRLTNRQLWQAQGALQQLVQTDLRGVHALQVKKIVEPIQEHLGDLQEVRKGLVHRQNGEIEWMEGGQEEWEEVLDKTHEIDADPLPQKAIEDVEISAAILISLDWMIENTNSDSES